MCNVQTGTRTLHTEQEPRAPAAPAYRWRPWGLGSAWGVVCVGQHRRGPLCAHVLVSLIQDGRGVSKGCGSAVCVLLGWRARAGGGGL